MYIHPFFIVFFFVFFFVYFFFSAHHQFLKPSFNLAGGSSKSQGARKLKMMKIKILQLIMVVTLSLMMVLST